ncbi:glycosyltransferase family 4 protein [Acinetobacter sp. VNK23]|uniref:glycosyltransferase family 4 protein n=1 Tax=Acinetobacter thutiue TaxID=2998078 RepID=UPI0025770CB0|nr:glycosyltransferase family 4 protein [Acinetobacter thutiue]MDM1018976.1 glycosyltransferase family 4 protein [Acinetobacter thutiue]
MNNTKPAIWFPTIKTNTGTDVFTERLVEGLNKQGIKAEITWLPLRAEYLPWTVPIPSPPKWATIVHVNTWLHTRFLPKQLPVIATLHHAIHDPELHPRKGMLRAAYHRYWIAPNERRVMQLANHVTAVSQFVAKMAQQTLCNVPIQVIYNSIDTHKYKPSHYHKKSNEQFQLLYVGAWRNLKGVDLLFPIISKLGDNFKLQYTGGEAAKKEGIYMPPNTHDLGRLTHEQVIKAMQNADALLFPSRSEGFGLVVIEAMACGLPVVITNCSALTELINHGVTGLLCEKDNIQDFVETIQYLKRNPKKCIEIGKMAREMAIQRFNTDNMLKEYINIYNLIVRT